MTDRPGTVESYADALEKAQNYKIPDTGAHVVQMIADGHARVKFSPRGLSCGRFTPEHYSIWLTPEGHAALRSHGRFRT